MKLKVTSSFDRTYKMIYVECCGCLAVRQCGICGKLIPKEMMRRRVFVNLMAAI